MARTLERGERLWEAARREADGTPVYHGRLPLFLLPSRTETPGRVGGGRVVRRYARGGAVAPVLGDRYLRVGTPRPLRELRASVAVREAGIPSPVVAAAVVYHSGPFLRGDLVSERVEGAVDLAAFLFGTEERPPEASPERRKAVLAEAGAMIRSLAREGIVHPDLNAKNLLVVPEADARLRMHLIDLDRARVGGPPSPAAGRTMAERLRRSLRRWEERTGRPLGAGEVEVF